MIDPDLSRVFLIDNSPTSYAINPGMLLSFLKTIPLSAESVTIANGIPIEGWVGDVSDECLLDLLPLLDSLRFTQDVRRVLGLRLSGSTVTTRLRRKAEE